MLEALLWLKKHNLFYADISIKEDNLEWMQGEDEVSLVSNAEKFKTKNSKQSYLIIASGNEYVSAAQVANLNQEELDNSDFANIDITTMHANQSDPLPGGTMQT